MSVTLLSPRINYKTFVFTLKMGKFSNISDNLFLNYLARYEIYHNTSKFLCHTHLLDLNIPVLILTQTNPKAIVKLLLILQVSRNGYLKKYEKS